MTESKSAAGSLTRPCVKCRVQEATLDSRSQPVCSDCFTKFIATKCIKQIGILGKETRPPPSTTGGPPTGTRRYLLGLSLGVSSTVLLHLLNENVEFQLAKGRNAPFDLTVVHVDTSPQPSSSPQTAAETALAAYRARYPRFAFHYIPLSSSSSTSTSTLTTTTTTAAAAALLQEVPTTTTTAASRSDILRTLTRRALLSAARAHACQALLLGHSTTALAELTLAEAAKGRGFALPWLVHDGPAPAVGVGVGVGVGAAEGDGSGLGLRGNEDGEGGPVSLEDAGASAGNGGSEGPDVDEPTVLVYHPLRDALRKELVTYASLVNPPLTDLIPPDHPPKSGSGGGPAAAAAVVSHKDLSIEEVMMRYFAEVEASYPSVVANVARTTGKLVRAGGAEGCALCGMPLDEDGDERWRGELGIQKETATSGLAGTGGRLCYGCERSTGA